MTAIPAPTSTRSSPPPTVASALSGPLFFARYAYAPNRLGYCGPDAVEELFGQGPQAGTARPCATWPGRLMARGPSWTSHLIAVANHTI